MVKWQVILAAGAWRLDGAELLQEMGSSKLEVLDLSKTATVIDDQLADALQGARQLKALHISHTRCTSYFSTCLQRCASQKGGGHGPGVA